MILMIDNYDSFTYNLVQYLKILGGDVHVVRNDERPLRDLLSLHPAGIVISPGPKRPEDAGVTVPLIRETAHKIPILGVCLGHQCIAVAFGGSVAAARKLMHGKTSEITADGKGLYAGIKSPFTAMRYHSLAVRGDDLPDCLTVTARADDGEVMGIRHQQYPTEGVQFHPESIMTPMGKRLLRNFSRASGIL